MLDHEFDTVFGPWAGWLRSAAEIKGAPVDFVALALLSTASALVGNTRWAVPWEGWKEPPIIWGMLVGDPSSGKSPALDAILDPVKQIDNALSAEYATNRQEWADKDEVAKLIHNKWKADAKAALEEGKEAPPKPKEAYAGAPPVRPRVRITDTTTEKAAALMSEDGRGLLLSRDELSGWLSGMDRYGGGGDRSFWLEAFGGRSFTVDRKNSPEPLIVDHLSIAILGGTQPDKLDSLLKHSDDDGLLARFLIAFPEPVPLCRPTATLDTARALQAMGRLRALEPSIDDQGNNHPIFLHLDDAAQDALQAFRQQCREWEGEVTGIMKSHIGKLPGLAVRVATVLALLDHAIDQTPSVSSIGASHLGRACHYVGEHLRKHAYRAYGTACVPSEVRAARQIAEIIKAEGLRQISTREISRRGLVGLTSAKEIGPAFDVLQDAGWIAPIPSSGPGRPKKTFAVNPRLEGIK
ncbi:YfjI family protein [Roseovarius sp. D0-M9]|uniref:YfjI family protein n=1 Tax=Roseovarius sp. D0-M9 TaxID=3127117 RepID=UPI0030102E90